MELWQMDIVGGIFLADGSEAKAVTGVDDHSRYCVIAIEKYRAAVDSLPNLQLLAGVPNVEKQARLPGDWLATAFPNADQRGSYLRDNDLDGLPLGLADFLKVLRPTRGTHAAAPLEDARRHSALHVARRPGAGFRHGNDAPVPIVANLAGRTGKSRSGPGS
jgi:hypothetical protein